MLGFNAAQINGDDMAGYKKLGLTGGAKIIYDLGEKWFPSMEFLYSQRGSRNNVFKTSSDNDIHIDLKYIEIPIVFTFQDWYIETEGYYKVRVEGGLSYGRLLGKSSSFDALNQAIENIRDNDLSFLLGAGYQFNRHTGFGLRYTRGITRLYQNTTGDSLSLLGYFLSLRMEYYF